MKLKTEHCGKLPVHPDLNITLVDGNWVTGKFKNHFFQAKVYAEPSGFGINEGRVSKLAISKSETFTGKDNIIFTFDRGEALEHPLGYELAALFDGI